ncbi:MAG: hypothetical protein FH761_00855 [Firmicutes bacterium]|nr:hypothetical protein [Bacillota bacterium]
MNNYSTLFKKDIWTLKNYVLELKRNPKRLIIYIIYLLWFLMIAFNGINAINRQKEVDFNFSLGPQILGALFITLITGLLIFSLYKGIKESSTFFSMGDVHFLFPSPISPKKILLYNMIKYSLFYLMVYGFVTVAIIPSITNFVKIDINYIPFMYLGFIGGVIVIEPLRFLIFSIGTKYRIQSVIQNIIYGFIGAFIIFILGNMLYYGNIIDGVLKGLNSPIINFLPLIGWSKIIFMVPIAGFNTYTIIAMALEILLIVLCVFLAYYTADDYYEDVIGITQTRTMRKRNKKIGNTKTPRFFVRKDKDIKVRGKRKGPMALFWKSKIQYQRTDLNVYFSMFTVILLVIAIVIGIIASKNGAGSFIMYIANGFLAYMIFIFSATTVANHELSKPYIYLIPGTTFKKIFAVHAIDVIRMLINAIVFNIALGILVKGSIFTIIMFSIFIVSFYILNLSSNFIVRVLFPSKLDQKVLTLFFLMIQFLFIILPGGIVGAISVLLFHSGFAFFVGVSVVNIIEITILLLLSNLIFSNMEWR